MYNYIHTPQCIQATLLLTPIAIINCTIGRRFLLSLIIICCLGCCFAQTKEKTEIYIIGNIHGSVSNYNPGILLKILENVKPDVILHEVDTDGMK